MNESDLKTMLARNPHLSVGDTGKVAKPQRANQSGKLALARQDEKRGATGVHIRFVSIRKRLLDPDNVIPKWTLDALRYVGVIRGDEPDKISLETTQRKAEKGEEERTIIEVYSK